MTVELASLSIAADPDRWRALGFTVDAGGVCRVGGVTLHLTGDGRHVRSWSLRGLDPALGEPLAAAEVDGLATTAAEPAGPDGPPAPPAHPNGTVEIDHLVVTTPDLDRTVAALAAVGLEPRRTREAGGGVRQVFFRLGGPVILELVGPAAPSGDGPARFFGIAFTVADLDATAARLGDVLHAAKAAVQPGRRIATLDRGAGAGTAVAFMSPGPHSIRLLEEGAVT